MNIVTSPVAAVSPAACDPAPACFAAAEALLPYLERGTRVDAKALRTAMEAAFGGSDASGAWDWKMGYDACEAALVLFLRKYGDAILRKAGSAQAALPMLERVAGLLPTHTRRSEDSQAMQQFSTPAPLALAAAVAAGIKPADVVLEPSAGTGLLAAMARIWGGDLALNELAGLRAGLLERLFADAPVTRFDAAQIHDHLDVDLIPNVILMNPPFSALANVKTRAPDAALRHVASALARLAPGGRLVAITGAGFSPEVPAWRDGFARLQETARLSFTAGIDGKVFARHGTSVDTRLLVFDKQPAENAPLTSSLRRTRSALCPQLVWHRMWPS